MHSTLPSPPASENWSSKSSAGQDPSNSEKNSTDRFKELTYSERLIKGLPLTKMFSCPEPIGAAHNCQYYSYDWENKTDIGQLLTNRMSLIK